MNLSIIIPLYNEEESLPELSDWITEVVTQHQFTYEVIMIDDGSNDNSWQVIEQIANKNPNIKLLIKYKISHKTCEY